MKRFLLKFLSCPICQNDMDLNLEVNIEIEDKIISGKLICPEQHIFHIVDSVPVMLAGKEESDSKRAFTEQWDFRYKGKFEKENRVFWLENSASIKYLSEKVSIEFKENDLVLDAGCGSGEKASLIARTYPGINMIAMDFSNTISVFAKKAEAISNLHVLQGDVSNPPFKKHIFNKIISIGVVHHTPDTYKAFSSLAGLVAKEGRFVTWIYPHYSESPVFQKLYYLFRDYFFFGKGHKIPANTRLYLLKILCIPALLFSPVFLFSKFINRELLKGMSIMDFYNGFVFMAFDDISPKFQFRHKKEEVFNWYREHSLENVKEYDKGLYVGY